MEKSLQQNYKTMKRVMQLLTDSRMLSSIHMKSVVAILLVLFVSLSELKSQYVSGDTSVCPGATVSYNFAGGPWVVTVLGGGTLVPVGPTNNFTINWGQVPGSFLIRLISGPTTIYQNVYVEGDVALACDDLVNVSLNGNCQALITPGVVLEGGLYPDDSYQVTVYNTNNLPIPGNIVDYSYLGKILKVNIRHICSGIACWGKILIEDKYIPELECADTPALVSCDSIYSPENIGFPLPVGVQVTPHPSKPQCYVVKNFDLCCDVELCYYDVYQKFGCNAPHYAQVERNWSAVDCKGNKTSCKDSIYITQGQLTQIAWPSNYDGFDKPALKCDDIEPAIGPYPIGWNALDNGNPSPYEELFQNGSIKWFGTGVPRNIHCDHIAVTYRDIRIPVCGNSFKLLRTWRVFDWCTGDLQEHVQFIKVTDEKAPIVSCSQNYIRYPMDYYSCTGTAVIPPPDLIIDCSATSYTVEYKLAGPDGKPEAGDYRSDNVSYINGKAVIKGLPKDTTWVQYVISDACGNVTRCRVEVLVEDKLDPVAVCDEHTVVSLNEQGVATLFASSVNNGSFDNCTVDSMVIRRMNDWCGIPGNLNFGPKVTFCCEDLTRNPHMVVFRVFDASGNFNDCMVSVTVQEKIAPTITCPQNITVNCGTDLSDLKLLGRATASNTCSNVKITYTDDSTAFKCGTGTIRRRWFATSVGGLFTACDQSIKVIDNNPITVNSINWPADITVNGCKASDAHPDFTRKPTFPVHTCSSLISGYSDERFYNVGGYCLKIIRHWRVIDWCLYDVNNPNSPGVFTRDQIIYVRNTVAPVISNATCTTKDICADDALCSANVELIASATDDCTDSDKLIWSYRVDLDNDGSYGSVKQGNNASGNYPVGVHKIEWSVQDSCGNIATCNQTLRVNDCKAPTPFCKTGIVTVVMPSTKSIAVTARYFDLKSEDNCTPQNKLKFSFSSIVSDSVRTYTCADIQNGIQDTIDVNMYVTDGWNNQSFCRTVLILQDPQNVCPNRFTNGGIISGLVSTNNQSVLQNAKLELYKEGLLVGAINSERTGNYTFLDLPEGETYMLKPKKDDDIDNGVSTADIVLIQKHILGIQKFATPYQYIAADVNNSQSVTAADISEIRKLILGITDRFKEGVPSWVFLKKGISFDNDENPWLNAPWSDSYEYDKLTGENKDADFMAIKTGDVNLSAKSTELHSAIEQRSESVFKLELEDELLPKAKVKIPVYGSWNASLIGFQMSIHINPSVAKLLEIEPGVLDINETNLGRGREDEGIINMSWNGLSPVSITTSPLFYLLLDVNTPIALSKLIQLYHNGLTPEAYTNDLQIMAVELGERGSGKSLVQTMLFQNQPNPFTTRTIIGFQVPEDQIVQLRIFDLKGIVVKSFELQAHKGKNTIELDAKDFGGEGMYYYQMETSNYFATKKLIISK